MVRALFKRNMISGIKVLLILLGVISMYTVVIIYMYNPEISQMLSGYQEVLPEMMAAVGMTGIADNILEWIRIYLYGFIMILFPLIFEIIIVNKLVVSYIDKGSMAVLLSTPHSRKKIIFTQAVSLAILVSLLLICVTTVGIASCQIMFPGELDVKKYILLNGSEILLQLMMLGIIFLFACMCTDARYFYAFGAGIPLVFFLIQMLANMGGKLEKLKYFTLYSLFPSGRIVDGTQGCLIYNLVMASLSIAFMGTGIFYFTRRDLSV